MTATEAFSWTVTGAAMASVAAAALIILMCLRHMYPKITSATVGALVVGLVFMTVPKWTSITIDAWGMKATIAKLQLENGTITAQRDAAINENKKVTAQIGVLQRLASFKGETAQDLLNHFSTAKADVTWATFIPTKPTSYDITVNDPNNAKVKAAALRLGVPSAVLVNAASQAGIDFVTGAEAVDLTKTPSSSIRFKPFAGAVDDFMNRKGNAPQQQ